ncbi:MAG: macro domain-containing protein [Acetatifactor sp.]
MPFKIIRNDITKMNTEAIVNTANAHVTVGVGCDRAVYMAAGYEELLKYRAEHIGFAEEGEAFLTPGFHLQAKYIIHTVSPLYRGGDRGEEEKLRSCYREPPACKREWNQVACISSDRYRRVWIPEGRGNENCCR